jgi:Protein of unknown function (DUF2917)
MPLDFVPKHSQHKVLRGRTTLQLDNAEGSVVAVESGCLWITMEDDPRDIVLTPGMSFEIDRTGRTLVTAEEDARFALLAPGDCPEGVAARIARRLFSAREPRLQRKPWDCVPHY